MQKQTVIFFTLLICGNDRITCLCIHFVLIQWLHYNDYILHVYSGTMAHRRGAGKETAPVSLLLKWENDKSYLYNKGYHKSKGTTKDLPDNQKVGGRKCDTLQIGQ